MAERHCTAEDVVTLAADGRDGGRLTIRGEVLDYTGEAITIARPGATPRSFPAERVVNVETDWNEAHQAGRAAYAKQDFQTAARLLVEANRAERRTWVRRLILADLMRSYASLGQPEQAGEMFVAIAQSDPTTPAVADAPVAWSPDSRVRRAAAEAWLARRDQPAAVLLGASHMLAISDAANARQALHGLMQHDNPRIAALAEAQSWRTEVIRATLADAARWARRIELMPDDVRAGPYFVLGQAYQRLGLEDPAILAYLRVPIHYGRQRELAARALAAAGRVAKQSKHPDEARLMLGELASRYAETPAAAEAKQLTN